MRSWCWRALAAGAALILLGAAAPAGKPVEIKPGVLAQAERSVVRVIALALDDYGEVGQVSLGSGFVVAPGKVITNNHVIDIGENGGEVRIFVIPERDSHDERQRATLVKAWSAGDLALLSAPRLQAPPLPISPVIPGKDSTVHALGYPGYTDAARQLPLEEILSPAEPYVTPGSVALVSRTAPGGGAFETIFHTAPVNRGNSGGPLIDACGRVIGVNTWAGALQVGDDGQVDLPAGQFAAVHASLLAGFLEGQGATVLPVPCLPPLAPAIEERFKVLEGALAAESKARKAAETALTAREKKARGMTTGAIGLVGALALAALAVALMVGRRRPPEPEAKVEPPMGEA